MLLFYVSAVKKSTAEISGVIEFVLLLVYAPLVISPLENVKHMA